MKRWFKIFPIFVLTIGLISAGNQTEEKAVSSENTISETQQPFSFLDLYHNVFETSCALSNCHDGNFEPNFTSPQAAYYSTVFHGVKKNSLDYSFTYRIVPYKVEESLLMERVTNCCFNNDEDRMPLLMGELEESEIDSIKLWINNGAPDAFGEFPYLSVSGE